MLNTCVKSAYVECLPLLRNLSCQYRFGKKIGVVLVPHICEKKLKTDLGNVLNFFVLTNK